MRKLLIFFTTAFIYNSGSAQPARSSESDYTINNISLPAELDKQVCISGMKYFNNSLYLVSERCPKIFVLDPSTAAIKNVLDLRVPQEFEMEGMTSYKGKLYLVSESRAAIYEVEPTTGALTMLTLAVDLPEKTKNGDGMEGIATNEIHNKFYLLRERTEDQTHAQIYTFSIDKKEDQSSFTLKYESTIELVLENPQWRYSDICVDLNTSKLMLLKSYSKGKLRQQFLESLDIDSNGVVAASSLKNVAVTNFSTISNQYKDQGFSMNLEGITTDDAGKFYMVSDNHNGKPQCEQTAKERTILFQLTKTN